MNFPHVSYFSSYISSKRKALLSIFKEAEALALFAILSFISEWLGFQPISVYPSAGFMTIDCTAEKISFSEELSWNH